MTSENHNAMAPVADRLRMFLTDPANSIVSDTAIEEALTLIRIATTDDGSLPVDVAYIVATLYWRRFLAQPPGAPPEDIAEAVKFFGGIASVRPDLVPEELRPFINGSPSAHDGAAVWGEKANYLLQRGRAIGDIQALEHGVLILRKIVQFNDHPAAAWYKHILGTSLAYIHKHSGKEGDLDDAIRWFNSSIRETPADLPDYASRLSDLGIALRTKFGTAGDSATLDESIYTGRRAIAATDLNDPDLYRRRANLGQSLMTRFASQNERIDDINEAVQLFREALSAIPLDDPRRAEYVPDLRAALTARAIFLKNDDDLDEAIAHSRQMIASAAPGASGATPNRQLAIALRARFEKSKAPNDLDEAIAALLSAYEVVPPGQPGRVDILLELSQSKLARFRRTGHRSDIDAAVDSAREAVATTPFGHRRNANNQIELAGMLQARFETFGVLSDIDEAVEILRSVLQTTTANSSEYQVCSIRLANTLRERFQFTSEMQDISDAVRLLRLTESAPAPATVHAVNREHIGHSLGVALTFLYTVTGRPQDLHEAARHLRGAASRGANKNSDRAGRQADLGNLLLKSFERTGNAQDLDEAVDLIRAAVAASSRDDPYYARRLTNLKNVLIERFDHRRQRADLDEAVAAMQSAVSAIGHVHADRAGMLSNLGLVLCERGVEYGSAQDLDDAIRTHTAAVELSLAGPSHTKYLERLAVALARKSALDKNGEQLEVAINILRTALADTPDGHRRRPGLMGNLGMFFFQQFKLTQNLSQLDEAIRYVEHALSLTPVGDPDVCGYLKNLGNLQHARFVASGNQSHGWEALSSWKRAAGCTSAKTWLRVGAAGSWGRLGANLGDDREALAGYRLDVELMPRLAMRGIARTDQERLLAAQTGVAREAAAHAIAAGDPQLALELLEQGRGVLWTQLVENRSGLEEVREFSPDLADDLARQLAVLDGSKLTQESVQEQVPDQRDLQLIASRRFDEIVKEIRKVNGFESFLRPPSAIELREAAVGGPVVVINIANRRCDAILITTDAVRAKELDQVTQQGLEYHVNRYAAAQAAVADRSKELNVRTDAAAQIVDVLRWLWESIALVVLDDLGFERSARGELPRIWWCPTGPLALLPLHAAGDHSNALSRDSVPDRVVSSLTPTVGSLLRARRATIDTMHVNPGRILLVAMPTTPGQVPLPAVDREIELIERLFPNSTCTSMVGEAAIGSRVLEELGTHQWAHISCHGYFDFNSPTQGGIVLHDGLLTTGEISRHRHAHGEFAFLSACNTHVGSVRNMDEVITLAAALHYVGWRHIVATVWATFDTPASQVARQVYAAITRDGRLYPDDVARELHRAVQQLRGAHPTAAPLWLPFVHIGP